MSKPLSQRAGKKLTKKLPVDILSRPEPYNVLLGRTFQKAVICLQNDDYFIFDPSVFLEKIKNRPFKIQTCYVPGSATPG